MDSETRSIVKWVILMRSGTWVGPFATLPGVDLC